MAKAKTADKAKSGATVYEELGVVDPNLASFVQPGSTIFTLGVNNNFTGVVTKMVSSSVIQMACASWVPDSGVLSEFLRNGSAQHTQTEAVGDVLLAYDGAMPFNHPLPNKAPFNLKASLQPILKMGSKVFVFGTNYNWIGRIAAIFGERKVRLEDASWIADAGAVHTLLETGTSSNLEYEYVGDIKITWHEMTRWPNELLKPRSR